MTGRHAVRRAPEVPAGVQLTIIEQSVMRSPKFARLYCWLRDRGICAVCTASFNDPRDEVQHKTLKAFFDGAAQGVALVYRCPAMVGRWQVDHTFPLHAVNRRAREAYTYWLPTNLRTICRDCHGDKNRDENGKRGKVNRIRDTDGLTKPKMNKRDRYLNRRAARPDWL